MRIKNLFSGLCISMLLGFSATASAELLIDPVGKSEVGKGEIGAFFGNSTVKYSTTNPITREDATPDVKRQYVSAYYAYGLSENLNLFVTGGFIMKAKTDDDGTTSGDSGFVFGGGARGNIDLDLAPGVDVSWYAQLLIIDEDYGKDYGKLEYNGKTWSLEGSIEGSIKDFSVGAVLAKTLKEGITIYGGPEFVFYKDGDLDWSVTYESLGADPEKGTGTGTESLERDKSFGLRLGAKKEFSGMIFSVNAALMNESSFSIGVNMPFGGMGGGS